MKIAQWIKILYGLMILLYLCLLTACQTTSDVETNKTVTAAKINVRLGMAYLERRDTVRSKQKLLLAMQEAPHIPEPWYAMGYFMEETGNRAKAKEFYLKSLAIAPHRADTLNNYGTYLCRSGDYQGAISYFMQALKDPEYLEPAAAYENAGLCALKIPDQKMAMVYFKRAIAEDATRPLSHLKLAELSYQQGRYRLARVELTQFLQFSPPTLKSYQLEQKIDQKWQA